MMSTKRMKAYVAVLVAGFVLNVSEAFLQATPLERLAAPADPSMATSIHQQPKPAATYLDAARVGTVLAPVTGCTAPMATTTAYNEALFRGGRRGPARGTIVAVSSSAKRNNEEGDGREEQASGTAATIGGVGDFSASGAAVGGWIARVFLRSTPGAAAPLAVALLLVASTAEQDIMAAMGGLDGASSLGGSQGQPALSVPVDEAGGRRAVAGQPSVDLFSARTLDDNVGVGNGAPSGGGRRVLQGTGGLDVGDTDLTRSLDGGARQAGPLTHGF